MSERQEPGTFASRALAQFPGLRERVKRSPEFSKWLSSYRQVSIDNEYFYVVGGDMLKDEDEMILIWARQNKLVDSSAIEMLQSRDSPERSP